MNNQVLNSIESRPDFLVGMKGGHQVLVPADNDLDADGPLPDGIPPLTGPQTRALIAPGVLSSVEYDASGRATRWTIDGVRYTASYFSNRIVVDSSDGVSIVAPLDANGRFTGANFAGST